MKRTVLCFVACVCLLVVAQGAAAKDAWTSVRSQNFFLVGNASEKDIKKVATRLEQFRDVFMKLFPQAQFTSPLPTTVVVFKSDGSYKPFKPVVDGKTSAGVAGYFQPGEDVNYITLTTETRGENPFATIYHEYVHLLVNNNYGKAAVPPWFNEGLAEYYSTFDIKDDQKVYLGNLHPNHLMLLRQEQLIPLKTLFGVVYYSLHRNGREAKGLFYAQSWALVHYLLLGNNGRRMPEVGEYLTLLAQNVPTEKAFTQAFKTDFAGMEKELREYIRQSQFRTLIATFERKLEIEASMRSAPLSEAEAEAYLGDLLLHTNRLDEAAARLRQALALDPNSATAHASLGMVHMRQKRFAEARQHLQKAIAANSQNYLAHYYYAYVLSREGMSESGYVSGYAPEAAREMRASLRKAIELKPDYPESYHLLAWVNLVTNEQLDEGIELLKRARALSPGNEHYAFVLAQIYMRQEKFDAARQTVEPLARNASDPQMRAGAQSILQNINSMQEQLARYRGARDADGSDIAAARSQRAGQTQSEDDDNEGPPMTEAEARAVALQEALRKPQEGETRVQGVLTRIECGPKGIVFHVKVGERVLRLQSGSFESIQLTAFTPDAGSEITCGPRKAENPVVVTYRAQADARARTDGPLLALEFVPADFRLKQ